MKKTTFLIVGKHAVEEALKNPKRKIEKVFVTEDALKNLNRENADNFINNANTFGVAIPEGVNYNTFFPELSNNTAIPDIIYPDMILDINGDLVPR